MRVHRTHSAHLALRNAVVADLLAGKSTKVAASEHRISLSWLYRLAADAGFACMLLTAEEREHIMARRKASMGKVAA